MALITCGECKNKISQSDLICPYCGHRNKERVQWWKNSQVYKIVGLVFAGTGVFLGIIGNFWGIALCLAGVAIFIVSKFLPQW